MANYYDNLRAMLQEQAKTQRGDIESNFGEALSSLTSKSKEAADILSQLEGSAQADPSRWVSTSLGVVQKGVQDVVDQLTDLAQRGGFRDSPGMAKIVEDWSGSMAPMVAQLTRDAMKYKGDLGVQRAGLTERLGVGQSGIAQKKGELLSGIGSNLAGNLEGVGRQEASEAAAIEAKKQELANALAIAGKLTAGSTKEQMDKLGVTANLGKVLNPSESGGIGGLSGGSASELGNLTSLISQLKQSGYYPRDLFNVNSPDQLNLYNAGQSLNQMLANVTNAASRASQNLGINSWFNNSRRI